MIYALVILLGLAISFSEKLHLFQLPFSIGKASIITTLLIIGALSWYKDYSNNSQIDRIEHKSDSLNIGNKVLIAGNNILNRQIDSLRKDNKDYHVSTTEILAQYGYKVDTYNHRLEKLSDRVSSETQPTLMVEQPQVEKLNSENVISYNLASLNADAHLVNYYYVVLSCNNFNGDSSFFSKSIKITCWRN